jgi:hypothetical protein
LIALRTFRRFRILGPRMCLLAHDVVFVIVHLCARECVAAEIADDGWAWGVRFWS